MDRTPFDVAIMAVELILTVLVLSVVSIALTISSSMTASYQREADIASNMENYAIFNKYDNVRVSGSDVVEAVYMHAADDFPIRVRTSIIAAWATQNNGNLTLENLLLPATNITLDRDYQSALRIDANGTIIGIDFTRQ